MLGENCEAVHWEKVEVGSGTCLNSLGLYFYLASNRHLHTASTRRAEVIIAANR